MSEIIRETVVGTHNVCESNLYVTRLLWNDGRSQYVVFRCYDSLRVSDPFDAYPTKAQLEALNLPEEA